MILSKVGLLIYFWYIIFLCLLDWCKFMQSGLATKMKKKKVKKVLLM